MKGPGMYLRGLSSQAPASAEGPGPVEPLLGGGDWQGWPAMEAPGPDVWQAPAEGTEEVEEQGWSESPDYPQDEPWLSAPRLSDPRPCPPSCPVPSAGHEVWAEWEALPGWGCGRPEPPKVVRLNVLFDRPVAALGEADPPDWVILEPQPEGSWEWLDPSALIFSAPSGLPPGRYCLTVTESAWLVEIEADRTRCRRCS